MIEPAIEEPKHYAQALVKVAPLSAFIAVQEATPEPLVGSGDRKFLAVGGSLVVYGAGGVGKTTLTIDLAWHLAAGRPWLGFDVPRPTRVLLLENEGPRAEFRLKLARKENHWDGPSPSERLFVVEDPWRRVNFSVTTLADALAAAIAAHEVDVLVAGPIRRLGLEGGGTPAEAVAFMALVEDLQATCGRPLAVVLVHHENKGGDISGAFEAEFDTVVHLDGTNERHRSAMRVRKARWSSAIHGATLTLAWVPEGEGFVVVHSDIDGPAAGEAREIERDTQRRQAFDWLVQYVCSSGAPVSKAEAETAWTALDGRIRARAREAFEQHVEAWRAHERGEWNGDCSPPLAVRERANGPGTYLIPSSHAHSPLAILPTGESGECGDRRAQLPAETSTRHSPPPIEIGGEWRVRGESDAGEPALEPTIPWEAE